MAEKREMTFDELCIELEKTKKQIGELEVSKQFLVEKANSLMKRMAVCQFAMDEKKWDSVCNK